MQLQRESVLFIPLNDTESIPFTCHHYISRQHTPEVLPQLATGELFQVKNPITQEIAPVIFPCVYEDSELQFLVFYNPDDSIDEADFRPSLFEDLTGDYTNYTMRVTTTLADFFEKINILDAQKLDTEVESVKLLTYTLLKEQQPELEDVSLHYYELNDTPVFALVTQNAQNFTPYRQELVDVVTKKLGDTLVTPKGKILNIDVKWAIDALELN